MSTKQNILARLRASGPQVANATFASKPEVPAVVEVDANDVSRFIECLQACHAQVAEVSAAMLATRLAARVRAHGLTRLLVSEQLQPIAAECGDACELISWQSLGDAPVAKLFDEVPAALTGSFGGICETGSIVLWPTAEEPRTVSLVPPVHFVVVYKSRLVKNFTALLAKDEFSKGLPTNLVLVSGPSKTADIQQTLAYGAHGPHSLEVFLVDDTAQ
ncbi:LUD domain-containing protein [Simiduia sp. 21SJ11W-1]|uniref:LutC/YkgG family protein n=1 Tax=Simiduia sp. 21SJ11W-1 TaxID=2909669 RepID=UPI00209F89D0|nr:LUD domain-containing protein [Simiduia sp. 21SJ11W-1]UTA48366.1 LUD domain-containing protein [Simiduia sp. 21SJ11W-1]